jgi:hypothetical protein
VKAITDEELASLSLPDQEQKLSERTRQLHEQEARKAYIAKLKWQQNEIVQTEKETDMDSRILGKRLDRMMRDDDGNQVEKRSIKEPRKQPPEHDNIAHDPSDDVYLEKLKAELERTQKNLSEISQNLEKSTSEPSRTTKKRKLSVTNTPSVNEYAKESPPKKSKSDPGTIVKQKCYICTHEEMKLWSTDPKDRTKQYCYHCHTTAIVSKKTGREGLNCCSYKPPTGGQPCFRKNVKDLALCEHH